MLDRPPPGSFVADGVPRAAAPVPATLPELLGAGPALVLSPHPDDESLACGGLLAAAFAGPGAHVICLTDGAAPQAGAPGWPPEARAALRRRELEGALETLGGGPQDLTWLGLPDARSDRVANLGPAVASVIEVARVTGARSLFAPCETDANGDHEVAAAIAGAAARMAGLRLWSYPVWSRWHAPGFRAQLGALREVHFDPAPWRETKRAAIARHRSQLGEGIAEAGDACLLAPSVVERFAAGPEIFFEREPR